MTHDDFKQQITAMSNQLLELDERIWTAAYKKDRPLMLQLQEEYDTLMDEYEQLCKQQEE